MFGAGAFFDGRDVDAVFQFVFFDVDGNTTEKQHGLFLGVCATGLCDLEFERTDLGKYHSENRKLLCRIRPGDCIFPSPPEILTCSGNGPLDYPIYTHADRGSGLHRDYCVRERQSHEVGFCGLLSRCRAFFS